MYLRKKQGKHCVAWPHLVRFFRGFWATDRCGRRHDFQSIRVPISQPIGKRGFADASKSSIHRNRLCFGRQARRHGAGYVRGARRENCTLSVKAQVCLHLATLRNTVGHAFIECHSTTWSVTIGHNTKPSIFAALIGIACMYCRTSPSKIEMR